MAGRAGLVLPPLAYDVTVPRPSRQGFGEHQCRAYSAAVVASFLFLTKYLRSLWRYLVLNIKRAEVPEFLILTKQISKRTEGMMFAM